MPSDKNADRFDILKKKDNILEYNKNTKSILTFEVNKKGQINYLKEVALDPPTKDTYGKVSKSQIKIKKTHVS